MFVGIRRSGDLSYCVKRGASVSRAYIPNSIQHIKSPFNKYHTSHICGGIKLDNRRPQREELIKISRELEFILLLPMDIYDFFLLRFDGFKVRQTKNDFNELDEVALLIQDVRQIIYKKENVNKYAAEVALSALSQYCKDIDLLFLKKAREDALFNDLRKSLTIPDDKILSDIHWPSYLASNKVPSDEMKELTFWKEPSPNETPSSSSVRVKKHLEVLPKEDINTKYTDITYTLPQKEEQGEPIPTVPLKKNFLHDMYLILSSMLKEHRFDKEKTSEDLGMTLPQMSKLIQILDVYGYDIKMLPKTFTNGILSLDEKEKEKFDKRNKNKRDRKKHIRVLIEEAKGSDKQQIHEELSTNSMKE